MSDNELDTTDLFLRVTLFVAGALMLAGSAVFWHVLLGSGEEAGSAVQIVGLIFAVGLGIWGAILSVGAFMPEGSRFHKLAERVFPNATPSGEIGCLFMIALLPVYGVALILKRILR